MRSANPVESGAEPGPLAELIAEVLDAHEGHFNRSTAEFECVEYSADGELRRVPVGDDYQGWLRHVAPLIAERIERATPPVQLTSADLCRAAHLIQCYAAIIDTTDHHHWYLISFADRLVAAANADPSP